MERVCFRHASTQVNNQHKYGGRVSKGKSTALSLIIGIQSFTKQQFFAGEHASSKDYMIFPWSLFPGITEWYLSCILLNKPITPSCFVRFSSHNEYEKGVNSFLILRQQSGILDNERRLDPAIHLWSVEI